MSTKKKRTTRKKRSMSVRQAKTLAKGQRIQKEAMKLMKVAGQKTVTKKVYKMTLPEAMKKAARKLR